MTPRLPSHLFSISGTVETGLGNGGKFLSMEAYAKRIQNLIGFRPFAGTLNVRLFEGGLRDSFLGQLQRQSLSAFSYRKKKFGGFDLFPVRIGGKIQGAVIFPHKTTHPARVLELIAREHLRTLLHLKDGDLVRIEPPSP